MNPCFLDLSLHDLIYEFNFSSIDEAAAVDKEAPAVDEEAAAVDEEAPAVDEEAPVVYEEEKEEAPGTIYNRFFFTLSVHLSISFF